MHDPTLRVRLWDDVFALVSRGRPPRPPLSSRPLPRQRSDPLSRWPRKIRGNGLAQPLVIRVGHLDGRPMIARVKRDPLFFAQRFVDERPLPVQFAERGHGAQVAVRVQSLELSLPGDLDLLAADHAAQLVEIQATRGGDHGESRFALDQNVPNPFNPHTRLSYTIPESSASGLVELRIYDVKGRLVRTLENEVRNAGPINLTWDGRNNSGAGASSGVYFTQVRAGSERVTRKIVFLK